MPCRSTVIKPAYKSAATRPAAPSRPGRAVAMAPESEALLEAELAAELRLELMLLWAELRLLAAELDSEATLLAMLDSAEDWEEETEDWEDAEEEDSVRLLRAEPGLWVLVLGAAIGCGVPESLTGSSSD